MSNYHQIAFTLADSQRTKLKKALNNKEPVTIEIRKSQINGPDILNLTKSQINKINRLEAGKGGQLKLSRTQITSMSSHTPIFTLSRTDALQAKEAMQQILEHSDKLQTGGFLGAIGKVVLPFIKNILPKVLGSLGLAAATGAISGATHKATSGQGITRAGHGIKLSKRELEQLLKVVNVCQANRIISQGTTSKIMQDLKDQKGGSIAMLLGSLAASILPALLSGKGMYRAGSKQ
jgi:hypothetical protein